MDIWATGMNSVDLKFLEKVKDIIDNYVHMNAKNVNWVISSYDSDESPLYY